MISLSFSSLEVLLFDLYLLFSSWVYFTGGGSFIRGAADELIQEKPWIHRALVAGISGIAYFWFLLRSELGKQKSVKESVVIRIFKKIPLTFSQWLWILFFSAGVLWSFSSCMRHQVFHSSFDLAIFVQAVWNTAQGKLLYSSIKGGVCLLADHFSPLLILFSLPYRFIPNPELLLIFQAFAAASAVFPIAHLARQHLKASYWSLIFAICYVLYLPVRNSVRFDFHPEVLVIPLWIWAFSLLREGKTIWSSICLLLALSAKENAALLTFAFGCYGLFFQRKKKFGLFWIVFSTLYFLSIVHWIIPTMFHQPYFYLKGNFAVWRREGLTALLSHLLSRESLLYGVKIFCPLGFLSFLDGPALILTFPMLLQNLTARNEAVRSIFFQYTAFLTPAVFISAIMGLKRLERFRWPVHYLLLLSILSSGISEVYVYHMYAGKKSGRIHQLQEIMKAIPESASVRTQEFLAPHLANRREIYIFENENALEGGSAKAMNPDYLLLDKKMLGVHSDFILSSWAERNYQVELDQNEYVILKR